MDQGPRPSREGATSTITLVSYLGMLTLLYIPCCGPTKPCNGIQCVPRMYGPSDLSDIGPPRDPRSVYSRPGPLNTSAFLTNANGVAVFARFTMPSLWTHVHGIAALVLSYDA